MKKAAASMLGAIAVVSTMAGTALADYSGSPSPTTMVEGGGGAAGVAGAGDTAFTGGSVTTALIVVFALATLGVIALVFARRRAGTS